MEKKKKSCYEIALELEQVTNALVFVQNVLDCNPDMNKIDAIWDLCVLHPQYFGVLSLAISNLRTLKEELEVNGDE